MSRSFVHITIASLALLPSCREQLDEEFTIRGQLYEGHSDNLAASVNVAITGYVGHVGIQYPKDFEEIAVTQTDENGHFVLTYEQMVTAKEAEKGEIGFYIGDPNHSRFYAVLPWNTNIDFGQMAEQQHKRVLIETTPHSALKDTLFFYVGDILECAHEMTIDSVNEIPNSSRDVIAISPHELQIGAPFPVFFKAAGGGDKNWNFRFGVGRNEIITAINTPDYNVVKPKTGATGFPVTDTIRLHLP